MLYLEARANRPVTEEQLRFDGVPERSVAKMLAPGCLTDSAKGRAFLSAPAC